MPTSTLTSRGQTTIPKAIRDALQLQPGDRVEFIQEDDRVVLRRAASDLTELDGLLDRSTEDAVSLEEMDAAIARGARESGAASHNPSSEDSGA
jgi:AbrB family looped-hinge helix DNA binding protein